MGKTLTKRDIADLAWTIADKLQKLEIASDTRIYFNDTCIDFESCHWKKDKQGNDKYICNYQVIRDINPHDYIGYCAWDHIITMSFEGELYDYLDYYGHFPDSIEKLIEDAGLYYEFGESWNLTMYPANDDMEIEYTVYEKPVEPMYIFRGCRNRGKEYPIQLDTIMDLWYYLGQAHGDGGLCAIGQKMSFTYKGVPYEMCPCTGFQGESSYLPFVDLIKCALFNLGAEDVVWDCGILD